ncbi:unnamed protein product [Schistocephalus solidus]|uniref:SH2 domain-containing protein n=1 Tax=Schistocephalus solidus TaxID=70667 RepID=A0A183SRN3_SCHSO|nr:unnamed protein product [Schistocephalus solidus]
MPVQGTHQRSHSFGRKTARAQLMLSSNPMNSSAFAPSQRPPVRSDFTKAPSAGRGHCSSLMLTSDMTSSMNAKFPEVTYDTAGEKRDRTPQGYVPGQDHRGSQRSLTLKPTGAQSTSNSQGANSSSAVTKKSRSSPWFWHKKSASKTSLNQPTSKTVNWSNGESEEEVTGASHSRDREEEGSFGSKTSTLSSAFNEDQSDWGSLASTSRQAPKKGGKFMRFWRNTFSSSSKRYRPERSGSPPACMTQSGLEILAGKQANIAKMFAVPTGRLTGYERERCPSPCSPEPSRISQVERRNYAKVDTEQLPALNGTLRRKTQQELQHAMFNLNSFERPTEVSGSGFQATFHTDQYGRAQTQGRPDEGHVYDYPPDACPQRNLSRQNSLHAQTGDKWGEAVYQHQKMGLAITQQYVQVADQLEAAVARMPTSAPPPRRRLLGNECQATDPRISQYEEESLEEEEEEEEETEGAELQATKEDRRTPTTGRPPRGLEPHTQLAQRGVADGTDQVLSLRYKHKYFILMRIRCQKLLKEEEEQESSVKTDIKTPPGNVKLETVTSEM